MTRYQCSTLLIATLLLAAGLVALVSVGWLVLLVVRLVAVGGAV